MTELNSQQLKVVELGRFMIDMSEKGGYSDDVLNALSRVGDRLTEHASFEGLSHVDQLTVKFAILEQKASKAVNNRKEK